MAKLPKKNQITIFELLATNATADARKLLKQHNQQDAKSYEDLELKLANFYHDNDDKVQIEKEFAAIHPHRKFILKNTIPAPSTQSKEIVKQVVVDESKTGCDGNTVCSKCSSSIEGEVTKREFTNSELMLVGMIGTVAIFGMFIHAYKR